MNVIPSDVNFNFILWPLLAALAVMLVCGFIAGLISKLLPRIFQRPLISIGVILGMWGFFKWYPF